MEKLEELQVHITRLEQSRYEELLLHYETTGNDDLFDYDSRSNFSTPVSHFTTSKNKSLFSIIIGKGSELITAVTIANRGNRAGTGLSQIELQQPYKLGVEIGLNEIVDALSNKVKRFAKPDILQIGGILSAGVSKEIIESILNKDKGVITHLTALLKPSNFTQELSDEQRFILQQQEDAVLTCLDIAEVSRDELQLEITEPSISFLDNIKQDDYSHREIELIINDADKFPFGPKIKQSTATTRSFETMDSRVDIIFAHTTKLETITGSDLIYYNTKHKSFIFVQYKALEGDGYRATYRPDENFGNEVENIKNLRTVLDKIKPEESNDPKIAYRFNSEAFYLKFCERKQHLLDEKNLAIGMYLPFEYFEELDKHGALRGPRGGTIIGKEQIGRYLTNTEFIHCVKSGFIGSEIAQSKEIEKIITATLEGKKGLIMAIEDSKLKK